MRLGTSDNRIEGVCERVQKSVYRRDVWVSNRPLTAVPRIGALVWLLKYYMTTIALVCRGRIGVVYGHGAGFALVFFFVLVICIPLTGGQVTRRVTGSRYWYTGVVCR